MVNDMKIDIKKKEQIATESEVITCVNFHTKSEPDETSESVNILITNVSPMNDRQCCEQKYIDQNNNIFKGEMTNEAPIKSIAYRLWEDGHYLDAIFFIESDKVRKKIENKGGECTHVGYLKNKINDFLGEYRKKTEYKDIKIKDEPSSKDVSETVFDTYSKLLNLAKKESEKKHHINIYIESNGGVRYVLTMLLSLTKTLENYYDNIHILEITSMVYNQDITRIFNTKDVFDTAQITGIADEFVNYGRINSLQRYMMGYLNELDDEPRHDIQEILKKLQDISDDIQLCRTSRILDVFYGKNNLKKIIENFVKKYKDKDNHTIITIFFHILELILNELNQNVYDNERAISVEPICNLPIVIRWCLDKSFVQQALTLVAERLPEYMFQTHAIRLSNEMENLLNELDTRDYEKKYYFVANLKNFVDRILNSEVNTVLNKIKKSNRIKLFNLSDDDWNQISKNSDLKNAICSDDLRDIADKIQDFINEYFELGQIKDYRQLKDMLIKYGFDTDDFNKKVEVSKKYKSPLIEVLRGKYINDDNKTVDHPKLRTDKERIAKTLYTLVKIAIEREYEKKHTDITETYNNIISEIFSGENDTNIANALIDKYSKKESDKFFVLKAVDSGHIQSCMKPEDFQKLLYIYSLCKEQRNFSNHAYVSKNDTNIALNSENLKKIINALLKLCTDEIH